MSPSRPCDAVQPPRTRLDKLGIGADSVVAIVGLDDPGFLAEVQGRTQHVTTVRRSRAADFVIYRATTLADLDTLAALRGGLAETGAIWVVWTKGRKALTEDHVRRAALAQGLVDIKVMAFSDELSGLKLVIPVAMRRASATRPKP